jgi:hypothetical protein
VSKKTNIFIGTFPDGNVFNCNVNADGQTVPFGTAVGTASNNSHGFTVYKDNGSVIFLPKKPLDCFQMAISLYVVQTRLV